MKNQGLKDLALRTGEEFGGMVVTHFIHPFGQVMNSLKEITAKLSSAGPLCLRQDRPILMQRRKTRTRWTEKRFVGNEMFASVS